MSNALHYRLVRLCLLFLLTLYASTLMGCRTRSFLSTKQEIALGREGARQIEQEYRIDISSNDAERVRRIGARLLPHVDQRDMPYSFKVLESPEINALSLPGGPVYVFRGLIDLLGDEDDDALACVIAHEIGHVNGRHAARQISSQFLTSLVIGFGVPAGANQDLARIASGLLGLHYSRDDELDADRRGLSYAHYAGYDPSGMLRVFEKFEQVERRVGADRSEWLRSHPLNLSRISRAEVVIENKNYRYGK